MATPPPSPPLPPPPLAARSRVKGVTFDLDDTLWCGMSVIRRASAAFHDFLEERAPSVATAFPPAEFNALLGKFQKEIPDKAHDYTFLRKHALRHCIAHVTNTNSSSSNNSSSSVLASQHDTELPIDDDAFIEEAFQAFLLPRSDPQFFDGVDELLQQLHQELQQQQEQTPRIGVITNGNCVLDKLPSFFTSQIDFMVSAESVGVAKPAAAIFDAALALFHQGPSSSLAPLARDEIVHVGDHYQADIVGAKQAGFKTIWIDATRTKPDALNRNEMDHSDAMQYKEADAIVTHVHTVSTIIRQWNQES